MERKWTYWGHDLLAGKGPPYSHPYLVVQQNCEKLIKCPVNAGSHVSNGDRGEKGMIAGFESRPKGPDNTVAVVLCGEGVTLLGRYS